MAFNIDQSDYPLPANTLVAFSVISVGQFFMFNGGVLVKLDSSGAFLFATASNVAFAGTDVVRLVDAVIKITPFTA